MTVLFWLAAFAFYAFHAYPAFAPRDSADMALAAVALQPAHPPGYPLYALLGKAWIGALPLGNAAYRLNLLSAAAGAGAAAVLFAWIRRAAGLRAGLAAGVCFALSAPLVKFSGLEEKYALHALFAAALLALTHGERRGERRRLAFSGLLFGLGAVNHQTLVLLGPALLWAWRGRLRAEAAAFAAAGLALNLFLWARLGDSGHAWWVLTRAEYGTLTLSSRFGSALSWSLFGHFFGGLTAAVSALGALLAAGGLAEGRRERVPLALALVFTGPAYFALTRFDVSGWIARSVLESAFLLPALAACALAGLGTARLERRSRALASGAVAALAAFGLARAAGHRADFAAYDYVRDLRRFTPPDGGLLLSGDTALFGWRLLEALGAPRREMMSALEDYRPWLGARGARGPVLAAGLSLPDLAGLGAPLSPEGPVLRLGRRPGPAAADLWELSAWRPSGSADSYSRDIPYSYAYARFLTGRLLEGSGAAGAASRHYRWAAALAPEEYQVSRRP